MSPQSSNPTPGNPGNIRCCCRGCAGCWRVEGVGGKAGAGDEAELGPFAELGVQVAGGDLEALGEFAAAPVSAGIGGHEGGDALPPGGRLGAGPGGVLAMGAGAGAGPAFWRVERRGGEGDADRGDGGSSAGAAVVPAEVAGGRALDLAGAVSGPAGGQQGGQDRLADDAVLQGRAGRADAGGGGELVAGGFQRGGEAGPVGVGAGPGFNRGDHGHAQQLVEGQQGP